MALILCPTCGKEVSDKAQSCPSCGTTLREEQTSTYTCKDCGATISADESVCPQCGCPIEHVPTEAPQKVELTSVNVSVKHTTKKRILISILVLFAAIGTFFGFQHYQAVQEEKQLAEAIEQYRTNLELVSIDMLTGAAIAESAGNLTKQVWSNCISKESSSATDKYVKPDGYFLSDFNKALKNLFNDDDFKKKISSIEENQKTVASQMKELKNPPVGYEDAYAALKTFYNEYLAFTNLVISPSGSLTTFSSNFNNADSATVNAYNALKIYFDDIY